MRRIPLTALLVLLLATPADAATRHVVRGAGFGHGIGMSQFGAYGYAQHGRSFRRILAHYYRGTSLGKASSRRVRVLLQSSHNYVRFRGATRLAGVRDLEPASVYLVRPSGGRLGLFRGSRLLGRYTRLRVYRPGGVVRLLGNTINGVYHGLFRGSLDLLPGGAGGVSAINRLRLDDYVRGVVAGEMPSSWHPEALKVQAVAARTYALATRKQGGTFDLYPDTRSQVYQGVVGERPTTNAAVRSTAGLVVTYGGAPIVTYYFSTSGGHTENVENVFLGSEPKPWLKGVRDPYDDLSPRHRWRFSFTTSQIDARLGSYSPGRFQKIRVLRRGVSPRVVRARVYGTGGTRLISGPTLRTRLGLHDTWAYFTRVTTARVVYRSARAAKHGPVAVPRSLRGVFDPAPRRRRLTLERRVRRRWLAVQTLRMTRGGRYLVHVGRRGVYRVRAGSVAGPAVRVR